MSNLNTAVVDEMAQKCLNLYDKLPKAGKPSDAEWTVLSCVVKYDVNNGHMDVVSLGTGSKCIGAAKMSSKGDIMNDSHAEIFARRGFLLYLYQNIFSYLQTEPSIFTKVDGKFKVKNNLEFMFYSSQLPCGDASILPKSLEEDNFGDILKTNKRHIEDEFSSSKRSRLETDIHRTGAKCLPNSDQDLKEAGINYHIVGKVRTKPGRGDRTLSVSCSDKMAKWIHLGIQGSLLDMLCEPIYITHFVFGAGVPYSEESLKRALLNRVLADPMLPSYVEPTFHQTTLVFPKIKTESNVRPAPGSIVWVNSKVQYLEVAVRGKKLGVTKKNAHLPSSSLCISKCNIYRTFMSIAQGIPEVKAKLIGQENMSIPYSEMKSKSLQYRKKWLLVKELFFKTWTVKPDMWDFCVS